MNLENRIAELEKQTKFQRIGIFSLGIMLVSAMLLGTSQDNVPGDAGFNHITAKAITIVGEDGKPVISMGSDGDGPGLTILDSDSTARIAIGINKKDKSAGLAFMDKNFSPRVAIGTNDAGEAGITLIAAGIREIMSGSTWPPEKK